MATKLTTTIVNQTKHELVIKVGTHRQWARLASVKAGGEYKMQVDVNWTFQEFVLEVDSTGHATTKLNVNSDDCCDYGRIMVTEVDGKLNALREPRRRNGDANSHEVVEAATTRRSGPLNVIHHLLGIARWKIW